VAKLSALYARINGVFCFLTGTEGAFFSFLRGKAKLTVIDFLLYVNKSKRLCLRFNL